jgi:hypothetical protein
MGIKKTCKKKELGQLATCSMKLMKNNLAKDCVENICNIYLERHLFKVKHLKLPKYGAPQPHKLQCQIDGKISK